MAERTVILTLRLRYSLEEPEKTPLLAEEACVCGFRGFPPDSITWLDHDQARALLETAGPESHISPQERTEALGEVLRFWTALTPALEDIMNGRAKKIADSHRRIRASAHIARRGLTVKPHLPPDLLGISVLLPIAKGVRA